MLIIISDVNFNAYTVMYMYIMVVYMGARRNFSRGGKPLGGAPKKSVKGGPHIFFRQALKYAYRGGGVVLMPPEFFSRGPQIY